MISDRFDHLYICPRDYDVSLAFYVDVLGWRVLEAWSDDSGARGCEVSGGGVRIVIAEGVTNDESGDDPMIAGGRFTLHLDIHNLQKRFATIPAGDHIVRAPEPTHWGGTWFVVRDPDGNLIAFNDRRQR